MPIAWNTAVLKRVIAALGAVIAVVFLAVAGLFAYSAAAVDDLSDQSETKLVARASASALARMGEDVASAAIWTDAYHAVARRDQDWLQINFGDYYADFMHHDVTVVYDGSGAALYASRASEPLAPDLLSADLRPSPPMSDEASQAEPAVQPPTFDDAWPKSERARRAGRSTAPDVAPPAAPVAPARPDTPQVTVLKSGVVDGMAYSLYSDGSIEAQMPEGMMRFASIDELRAHLDQRP